MMTNNRVASRRNLVFGAAALTVGYFSLASAQERRSNGRILNPLGANLWERLGQLPYAPQGQGIPLYVIGFSSCPYCLAFHREWQSRLEGVQLRWVMYGVGVDPASTDQAADIALTRNASLVNAYFERARVAPPFRSSQDRINAFNSVANGLSPIRAALIQEGFFSELVSPTFIWRNPTGVGVLEGYRSDLFMIADRLSKHFTA